MFDNSFLSFLRKKQFKIQYISTALRPDVLLLLTIILAIFSYPKGRSPVSHHVLANLYPGVGDSLL